MFFHVSFLYSWRGLNNIVAFYLTHFTLFQMSNNFEFDDEWFAFALSIVKATKLLYSWIELSSKMHDRKISIASDNEKRNVARKLALQIAPCCKTTRLTTWLIYHCRQLSLTFSTLINVTSLDTFCLVYTRHCYAKL